MVKPFFPTPSFPNEDPLLKKGLYVLPPRDPFLRILLGEFSTPLL